uniref:Odorant receptor n=1 Tax=Aphidius gifuensis TaxID=684658 RepID=A0A3Q9ELM4_APHGI|nr:odorant receptor [Aphidius gifuensis]
MSLHSTIITGFRALGLLYFDDNPNKTTISKLYIFYTFIAILMGVLLIMTEFIALTFSLNDPNEFAKATFLLLPNIVCLTKYLNIIIERKNIKKLMSYSKRDQFKPRDSVEVKILESFKYQIKVLFWTYGILVIGSLSILVISSCINDVPKKLYHYNIWFPVFLTQNYFYFMTFFYQHFTTAYYANVNVTFDTFIASLMMETQAHLQILKYRFSKINDNYEENINITSTINEKIHLERKYLIDCVEYYFSIHEFARLANKTFQNSIFLQFFVSTFVVCVSTFQLFYMVPLSEDFIALISFVLCMLAEIFIYCNYADNVTSEVYILNYFIKSIMMIYKKTNKKKLFFYSENISTSIFNTNWPMLSIYNRKIFAIIMMIVQKPIIYTSRYFVTLSLNDFLRLLKLSYSLLSVLRNY